MNNCKLISAITLGFYCLAGGLLAPVEIMAADSIIEENSKMLPPSTSSFTLGDATNWNNPPDVCMGCLAMAVPSVKASFSDFEKPFLAGNAVNGWWYCYNDREDRGINDNADFSIINAGIIVDTALPLGLCPWLTIDGHGKNGNGAYIGFRLGKTFARAATVIQPFVGIGSSLTDDSQTYFYNASAEGMTGIMFDYLITGVDYLRFEVISSKDLSDSGIVWNRLLPRGPEWQTAMVPFDSLKLGNWDKAKLMDPTQVMLKKNELKSIRFKAVGAQGVSGTIAIDNVYFTGGNKITRTSIDPPVGHAPYREPSIVLLSPANTATMQTGSVRLVWSKGPSTVTKYLVRLATDSSLSRQVVKDSILTDTTILIKGLDQRGTYWWSVTSKNEYWWEPFRLKNRFDYVTNAVLPKQLQRPSYACNGASRVLRYTLPGRCYISLDYYDISGRLVWSFLNQLQNPGLYSQPLPISNLARGTYIQVFRAGRSIQKDVITVVK